MPRFWKLVTQATKVHDEARRHIAGVSFQRGEGRAVMHAEFAYSLSHHPKEKRIRVARGQADTKEERTAEVKHKPRKSRQSRPHPRTQCFCRLPWVGRRPGPTVVQLVRRQLELPLLGQVLQLVVDYWYHVLHVWEAGPLRPQLSQQAGALQDRRTTKTTMVACDARHHCRRWISTPKATQRSTMPMASA